MPIIKTSSRKSITIFSTFRTTTPSSETRSALIRFAKIVSQDHVNLTKGYFFERKENNSSENDQQKIKEGQFEIQVKDMIPMLEINKRAKKMIHAPSLNVFKLQKVSENADEDRQHIYATLNFWRRLAGALPDNVISYDNVYYVSSHNSVQICLNHTRQYPLKVI